MRTLLVCLSIALLLAACGRDLEDEVTLLPPPVSPEVGDSEPARTSVYSDAVANPSRPTSDRERDAGRKPARVLEFFGIAPGDRVLEMFAGGGYYTELLAHTVGESGSVVAHMNTPMTKFAAEEFAVRHEGNRLANVEILMAENNELELEPGQFDAITMVLNFHDLYWVSDEYGWAKIDAPTLLAELHDALKADGVLCIVDHAAEAGSPAETGGTLHRIARGVVIDDLRAAGFVVDDESNVLRNPADDYSKNVFDPEVRGKTDRYVLRFRKAMP